VGGSAQIKPMKKVSGTLKLDLAQFRELEDFARFGSDLDKATQRQLDRGKRLVQLLIQKQYSPIPVEYQVGIIFAGTKGYLDKVPVDKVDDYEEALSAELKHNHQPLLDQIVAKKWTKEMQDELAEVCTKVAKSYE
jgi:F-type H+-transporting ATPase subunit alpha